MIKDNYKRKRTVDGRLELNTETDFTHGERKGMLSFEDDMMIFREIIAAKRKRSKSICRTAHFSVLRRPDGSIGGTFHFQAKGKKLRGQLSAEFWQAISLVFMNDKNDADEKR